MSLHDILQHRRAIRSFDPDKKLDDAVVRRCIELSVLAPTSSNMQLWEAYHVTDPEVLKTLAHACLDQSTGNTAQQMVVFVTRQDKYREHAETVLEQNIDNIRRTSPEERQENRIKRMMAYYGKVMPLLYARCFGLLGAFRKTASFFTGLFRPIVRQVSESDVRVVVHKSCALAVQTFMLAMSEAEYDTCPVEGFDSRLVRKALNLPCGAEVNMIITCGIRKPTGVWGERLRLPFESYYHKV